MTTILATWAEKGCTCEIKQLSNGYFSYLVKNAIDGIDGYTLTKSEAMTKVEEFINELQNSNIN